MLWSKWGVNVRLPLCSLLHLDAVDAIDAVNEQNQDEDERDLKVVSLPR
jgi:hypothetical protein